MSIHYRQYTDTFSILKITYKIIVCGEKNGQKLVLYYLENSKLPTKSLSVGKKRSKLVLYLSRKSSKDPSWLAMCNVYIRNELPTGLPAHFNAIQHKGDILLIRTCGDFYVSFVYQYRYEQSTCRIVLWIFRQLIISTINNSTNSPVEDVLSIFHSTAPGDICISYEGCPSMSWIRTYFLIIKMLTVHGAGCLQQVTITCNI